MAAIPFSHPAHHLAQWAGAYRDSQLFHALALSTQVSPGFVGFLVQREHGLLPKPGGRPVSVKKGRISLRFVSSLSIPPVFSIVILEDFPIACSNLGPKLLAYKNPTLRIVGENSISVLQLVLDNLLENTWYRGWLGLLDEIDDCVKIQATDILDSSAAEGLMLDDSLAQSKIDTRYDLEKLGNGYILTVQTRDVVCQNWAEVMRRFGVFEQELQKRIGEKKDEITGLRDGLFNASSLLEAHKATSMNRYIIIFTILTVFYLPLGFVTAVFSMDLFHEKELAGMKSQYTVTMTAVAITTYIAAVGLVAFVDRRRVIPYLMERLSAMRPTRLLPLLRKGNNNPDNLPTEIGEEEWEKFGQSGPWSGSLAAILAPTARQRRKAKKEQRKEAAGADTPEAGLSV